MFAQPCQPFQQGLAIGNHDADMAAQHLRLLVGKWNWLRPMLTHMLLMLVII